MSFRKDGTCLTKYRSPCHRETNAHLEFLLGGGGGGADTEAIYNLCLILKIML
jgi:hypothetical protein